jgi:hypothetical protein
LAIAVVIGFAMTRGCLESRQTPYVSLYGEVVDGHTLRDVSCHDLAYPEVRCFDTPEESIDDQIRGWPSRAEIIQEPDKPAYIVYQAERRPLGELTRFTACHALGFPEIRCYDSLRESLADQLERFSSQARSAREQLAALEDEDS